jgi:hypothetical protein
MAGKGPVSPLVGGVYGHNIKRYLHYREAPACLSRPNGIAGELHKNPLKRA